MTEKNKELLRLIAENPDLPVVPMVDAEVIGGDTGYWLGNWQGAYVGKYILHEDCGVILYNDSNPDIVNIFEKFFNYGQCGIDEELPDSEALPIMRRMIDALDWTRAIIVNISLPEEWGGTYGKEVFNHGRYR